MPKLIEILVGDYLLRDKEPAVKKIRDLEKKEELATTDINAFELLFRRIQFRDKDRNIASTKGLLKPLSLLHTREESMETEGRIFAERRARSKMMGIKDLLIAAEIR
jgi:predicted nucleic acid-binding protein